MEDKRRISVYDLTSLRLHPDGLRVHQTDDNLKFVHSNKQHRIKDIRGHWIADNAGGSSAIPVYRKPRKSQSVASEDGLEDNDKDEDEDEYIDVSETESDSDVGEGEESISEKGKRKRKVKRKNYRTIKRRRFLQDDSYLSGTSRIDSPSHGLPAIPSADLLKNIHKLAADYYNEQGLLLNASKRYRQRAKERKLRRLSMTPHTTPEESQTTSGMAEDELTDDDDLDTTAPLRRVVTRDMYKVLDGSVLMALGVLTQELVKKLIGAKVPTQDSDSEIENGTSEDDVDQEEDVEVNEEGENGESEEDEDSESEGHEDGESEKDVDIGSEMNSERPRNLLAKDVETGSSDIE